jgi:DNA modification methylase
MKNILTGDCLSVMPTLMANSIDSIVSDPPYGLSFMGKDWDHGVPGEHFWREALRVAKPGAHLLAFGGTRTFHRLAVAIEDAGWEIRDTIMWVYGSGFPKSLDVSKAMDKAAGHIGASVLAIKSEIRARYEAKGMTLRQFNMACGFEASGYLRETSTWASVLPSPEKWSQIKTVLGCDSELDALFAEAEREVVGYQKRGAAVNTDFMSGGNDITAPATDAARQWSGWGTALKPAWEPIIVARKPLDGTVASNVLAHGTGAINVDGCRVEGAVTTNPLVRNVGGFGSDGLANQADPPKSVVSQGRWPANLIHDGSQMVLDLFPQSAGQQGDVTGDEPSMPMGGGSCFSPMGRIPQPKRGDSGSAARFFYCAKASKADRNEGCDDLQERTTSRMNTCNGSEDDGEAWRPIDERTGKERDRFTAKTRNHHPTVKPTALMRYLCRLVTPPGGTILDPFMGSGSTGKAAVLEGFSFVGIEMQPEYVEIARARIEWASNQKETWA